MDSCDGLFGGFTPERRLAIMRDSRVGAFGAMGGTLALITQFAAIQTLLSAPAGSAPRVALLLAPVIGRWVIALALTGFPYARQEGMGRTIKDEAGWPQAVIASVIAVTAAWLIGGWPGLAVLALGGIAGWVGVRFTLARIPGLTGDSYGALCISTELVVLLGMVSISKIAAGG